MTNSSSRPERDDEFVTDDVDYVARGNGYGAGEDDRDLLRRLGD